MHPLAPPGPLPDGCRSAAPAAGVKAGRRPPEGPKGLDAGEDGATLEATGRRADSRTARTPNHPRPHHHRSRQDHVHNADERVSVSQLRAHTRTCTTDAWGTCPRGRSPGCGTTSSGPYQRTWSHPAARAGSRLLPAQAKSSASRTSTGQANTGRSRTTSSSSPLRRGPDARSPRGRAPWLGPTDEDAGTAALRLAPARSRQARPRAVRPPHRRGRLALDLDALELLQGRGAAPARRVDSWAHLASAPPVGSRVNLWLLGGT